MGSILLYQNKDRLLLRVQSNIDDDLDELCDVTNGIFVDMTELDATVRAWYEAA